MIDLFIISYILASFALCMSVFQSPVEHGIKRCFCCCTQNLKPMHGDRFTKVYGKLDIMKKKKKNYAEISKIVCIPNKSNFKLFLQIICNKLVSILRMCVWVCMQHLRECCFQCNKFCFNTEECKFFRMTNLVLQNIPPVFSLLQGNRV